MGPGYLERRSHDYRRYGTTSLFAALDVKSERVIGQCHRCHRTGVSPLSQGARRPGPPTLDGHLILDNYGTHKTQTVRRCLAARPRSRALHAHECVVTQSGGTLVCRAVAKQIKGGSHRSTRALETAIRAFVDRTNEAPKPSGGPSPPTKSWRAWPVNESPCQATSV